MAQDVQPDIISSTGKYKGELVVAGVDLRDKTIFICLKSNSAELLEDIQETLGLVG